MKPCILSSRHAFTLIELSIVVLVLALLAAAGMRYYNAQIDTTAIAATNAALDAIDTAIFNFQNNNLRLPCPADLTQAENTATFGTEIYAASTGGTLGDGNCGYISAINNNAAYGTGGLSINSTTDPDAAAGSDDNYSGAADPLYDSTTASQVVEGAVPTKTLRIPDRFAYDGWGNKIFFVVDRRMTTNNAYTTYPVSNTVIGAIVVKTVPNSSNVASTGTLANAVSYKGIYALISAGKNGHGAFARNLTATAVRTSAASTNADELDNCHCSGGAVATSFNRIFVQKPRTNDSTSFNDNFDDIVRFKTRGSTSYSSDLH